IADDCGVLIGVVGHAGDGNMHPTVIVDPTDEAVQARAYDAFNRILDLGLSLGGTITGEHGIGTLKIDWLGPAIRPPAPRAHPALTHAPAPLGILTPGKVFPPPGPRSLEVPERGSPASGGRKPAPPRPHRFSRA